MQLDKVVPWGRSLAEYQAMFNLTADDLTKNILGCSDGPASFNAELTELNGNVISVDPLFQFSKEQIQQRINQVAPQVMTEVSANQNDFIWDHIQSTDELLALRLRSMELFLTDYETGCETKRYLNQSLPNLNFADQQFDLALCSHFLFLYSDHVSLEFHQQALLELLRVAKQVRIYPLITLTNQTSLHLKPCLDKLNTLGFIAKLEHCDYQFQKGATQMLSLSSATT